MKYALLTVFSLMTSNAFAEPRPPVLLADALGQYVLAPGTYGCSDGGRQLCESAVIATSETATYIQLGNYSGNAKMTLTQANGVLVFSHEFDNENCDDPGCSDIKKIHGVVYNKKIGNVWTTVVKVTIAMDFPYPDEEGAPEGLVTSTGRLVQKN